MNALRKLIKEIEAWMDMGIPSKREWNHLRAHRHKLLKQLLRMQLRDWHND